MNDQIISAYRSAWQPPFRGEIYDYGRKLNLQKGYAIKGNFDVHRSRYLIDVFRSLKNPRVRNVVILKALQTAGTLNADVFVPYLIEHDHGDVLWLFQDDDFAKKYCETRFMPLLYSVPEIAQLLKGVPLHSKQKTTILFSHMTLIIGGLNEGNCQSLSWRYVIVDEGWMAKSNGLIFQAKARTTAFPNTSKFILISQGGYEGEDLDIEWGKTNQKEWAWKCPDCGNLQVYEWRVRRDDNSWAGMLWDTNERTRPGGGAWNMSEVLQTIRFACKFCPGIVLDNPLARERLNVASEYLVTNPGALPENVGHRWPAWANTSISFSSLVQEYLTAKTQADDFGYMIPLIQFYQKRLARAWNPNQETGTAILTGEAYDVNAEWPEELVRFMTMDPQKDFTKIHVEICAWSGKGNIRELYWGTVGSFAEAAKLQKHFKVKDQHVFPDLGYEQTEVAAECSKHGHFGIINGKTRWLCWHGLKGSHIETFTHTVPKLDGKGKPIRHPETLRPLTTTEERIYSPIDYLNPNIGKSSKLKPCPYFVWSNLHVKDILRRYRDGERGKVEWLPDELPSTNLESASNQMYSEYRARIKDEKTGRRINRWLAVSKKRPNHKWDCMAEQILAACIYGIIAQSSPVAETETPGDTSPS